MNRLILIACIIYLIYLFITYFSQLFIFILVCIVLILVFAVMGNQDNNNNTTQKIDDTTNKDDTYDIVLKNKDIITVYPNYERKSIDQIPKRNHKKEFLDLEFNDRKSINGNPFYMVVDTETDGLLPKYFNAKEDFEETPNIVSIAWLLLTEDFKLVKKEYHIFKLNKLKSKEAQQYHKFTVEQLQKDGKDAADIFKIFIEDVNKIRYMVAHNIEFDAGIVDGNLLKHGFKRQFTRKRNRCTMVMGKNICQIERYNSKGWKYPKLEELFHGLYSDYVYEFNLPDLHNALNDCFVTAMCLKKIVNDGLSYYDFE